MSSESSFQIHSDISHYDYEGDVHDYIQPIIFIYSFLQPFHDQKTRQSSSSLVEKSQNCLVSNAMSLVYVAFMSCMSLIGSISIELSFMGLMFHMYGLDLTTHGSIFKSPNPLGSLNC